ncbi:MAG: TAXI family TRAP transporter solute-binding subunit, partial [Nitrososphaerales archaeon]
PAAKEVITKTITETVTGPTVTKTITITATPTPTPSPSPSPTPTPTPTPTVKRKFNWGTATVGSTGHRALVGITAILNKYMPTYEFTVIPTPGAVASMKNYAKGELDGCYASDIGFTEMYRFEKRFEGFKPEVKRMPVQTFWAYTIEVTLAIHDRNLNKYKKWSDLNGKKIYAFYLGWDVHAALTPLLDTLGIKYTHVEMDTSMVGSALEKGEIEATGVYTTSYKSPPPWIKELEITTPIAILNPSEDELKKLKGAGFDIVEIDPKGAFATDVNVEKIYARAFFYGFSVGTEMPENDVYTMLKILEEHKQDLVAYDPGFEVLAKDFAGFQVRGIEALRAMCPEPQVPLHPGLAKYLKERGLWKDVWKVAK